MNLCRIPYLLVFAILSSCSTRGPETPQDQKKVEQAPSEIDLQNPPKLLIKNLTSNQIVPEAGLQVEFVVENYPLGEGWQAIEYVVNDSEPERVYQSPAIINLKEGLRPGANILRAYLVRSWGESLKNPEAFRAVGFYFLERVGAPLTEPKRPVLTLVSPRGVFSGDSAKKILFDFIVWQEEEAPKNFKVHYTLNKNKLELSSGKSYHFYNLVPGDYSLRVEVVNSRGIPLGQEVNRASSQFKIEMQDKK